MSQVLLNSADLLRLDDPPIGRAFFRVADLTVQVQSDLPITDTTFENKFQTFAVDGPGVDNIIVRHRFGLPPIESFDLGNTVHNQPPWIISRKNGVLFYKMVNRHKGGTEVMNLVAMDLHSRITVNFHAHESVYRRGDSNCITFMPTDQIVLARALALRDACFIHSSGAIVNGQALLFVGHSEAGKSTIVKMLSEHAEILCDDRNIIRRHENHFRVHGSWNHGEVPIISNKSAPLGAILFIHKAERNIATRIEDAQQMLSSLLACLIQPLITPDWFRRSVAVLTRLTAEVPCYDLEFDKSGAIIHVIKYLVANAR